MKRNYLIKTLGVALLLLLVGVAVTAYRKHHRKDDPSFRRGGLRAFPVEVTAIRRGHLEEHRVFSGSLEASAQMDVSPKVAGRITRIAVDIADPVTRNQVVVTLDDAEFRQELARAEANLTVARARYTQATNRLEIARRELERANTLFDRGVSSASSLDGARADYLVRDSEANVAAATVRSDEASLESARIRLSYTEIRAAWSGGDDSRVVAERHADEGDTVAPNTPLLTIMELQPLRAVFFVPERDYRRLSTGQVVSLTTDAWPGETFAAVIQRIAPVFREASRQARVEVGTDNADLRLKPGMFLRATVTLDQVDDAVMVPQAALVRRGDGLGIFRVHKDRDTAQWLPVTTGIRDGDWVELKGADLEGRVVTLGQQLLEEGSALLLPDAESAK